jgi:hypothetical protein
MEDSLQYIRYLKESLPKQVGWLLNRLEDQPIEVQKQVNKDIIKILDEVSLLELVKSYN